MAMVAVCDILGFSNLVRQRPLQEVVEYHIQNIQVALGSSIPNYPVHLARPTDEAILRQGLVGFTSFSDTVILYSLADNGDGYRAIINTATRLLARHILWPGLRFRIGIAYGEFFHDDERNIYVGRALIDAHDLEKRQDWCGAALTQAATMQITSDTLDRHYLTQYNVPMRNGTPESLTVINWTLAQHSVMSQEYDWIERDYDGHTTEEQQAIERKLRNTEKFHLDECVQCRAHRESR